jgi:hypothetical protein
MSICDAYLARIGRTLAIHWAPTTHGTWLHGDFRGSWRDGQLIGPDPYLEAEAKARMTRGAVILTPEERELVAEALALRCENNDIVCWPRRSRLRIAI